MSASGRVIGTASAGALEFAGFRIDKRAGGAFRVDADGASIPVLIGSRALDVLCVLAARPGELVSKREIMDAVWPDTVVEDKNLAMQISALRQVLEREGGQGGWIQTVPGRGYRFVPPAHPNARDALPDAPDNAAAPGGVRPPRRVASLTKTALAAVAACVLLVGAAGLVWSSHHAALPVAYSPQDRRQSIIVLPFENTSGDAAQDAVAAGIVRDLTDEIAEDPTSPLVPVAVAAAYRGKPLDLRVIGRDHNVRYALTGNARRQDGRLIMAATLYRTADARQVWSQRFDVPEGPDAWAGTVHRVRGGIDQAMVDEDFARATREHPDKLDKRDLMFAASGLPLLLPTKENTLTQIALIERALALDPNYVWALRENARKRANLVNLGHSSDPERDLAIAAQMLDRALLLAPNDFQSLREKAVVLRAQGNWSEAAALNRRLIERRPLQGFRYFELGAVLMVQGLHKEALENFETARRLAVEGDSVNIIEAATTAALVANGRYSEAVEQARVAIQGLPPGTGIAVETPWLALIAAETASGLGTEARADLHRFLAGNRTWRTMAKIQAWPSFAANPKLLAGLRDAGMPAE